MNALSRCDRCGAAAKETWFSETLWLVLLFCGHHANEHRPALRQQGWECTEIE